MLPEPDTGCEQSDEDVAISDEAEADWGSPAPSPVEGQVVASAGQLLNPEPSWTEVVKGTAKASPRSRSRSPVGESARSEAGRSSRLE